MIFTFLNCFLLFVGALDGLGCVGDGLDVVGNGWEVMGLLLQLHPFARPPARPSVRWVGVGVAYIVIRATPTAAGPHCWLAVGVPA